MQPNLVATLLGALIFANAISAQERISNASVNLAANRTAERLHIACTRTIPSPLLAPS
jgi:hypothetical protein